MKKLLAALLCVSLAACGGGGGSGNSKSGTDSQELTVFPTTAYTSDDPWAIQLPIEYEDDPDQNYVVARKFFIEGSPVPTMSIDWDVVLHPQFYSMPITMLEGTVNQSGSDYIYEFESLPEVIEGTEIHSRFFSSMEVHDLYLLFTTRFSSVAFDDYAELTFASEILHGAGTIARTVLTQRIDRDGNIYATHIALMSFDYVWYETGQFQPYFDKYSFW